MTTRSLLILPANRTAIWRLGYGPHVCLGQHLARLEMRIFWEELLPRLKSVEMTGPVKRVGASFVSSPFSVPIKFKLNG